MMFIRPQQEGDVDYVLDRLRRWNVLEAEAAFGQAWRVFMGPWLSQHAQINYTLGVDGEPAIIMGGTPVASKCWSVYFLATDRIDDIAKWCVRPVRRVLVREAASRFVTKVTARALSGNPKSRRWFQALGAQVEGYEAANGVTFETYAWTIPDVLPEGFDGSERRSEG